ncbi:DUF637 domain-containing protein [Acinetobacter sp. NIPH 298]|uniref:two-partner secretion domain-containing protein n=1 Tax=Acinetobacter sp. NIPH 298 TaxID=1217692 RepID=UPI0002D09941|nr:DUF637 domain-containing protein [Acinetobacter sp. NIPH 298]ENW98230.1 hypothetical protein F903_00029 [Acinetobacter sp. NIPH 298]
MNKNRYRIIYNKARQMFMAVAENAKSQSKASGQSSGSTTATTRADDESFHQLWHVKALVASMSMWMPLSTVYAGMVADTGAPAANRPVIGVGQNSQKQNVPVINIQTPNKSGVSHNIYKEFDVPTQGAVLNNSRTGAASSIVGSVGANPYLQTGEARLILNEVNSARASQFEGNLEIAGQRAELIIANPSGINVKGGGFINANRATLTTGKPQFNADGSIKQFVIDQGKISISANTGSQLGLGGANNNASYLDIYTRALELNAQLHAEQDIQVVTGANTISADLTQIQNKTSTAAAPTVAIDVKALGGMYANNIYLVGTEKGLGVNNAGTLQAVNNLVVTSAGKIEHTGAISSTSKTQGLVSVSTTGTGTAADINSAGTISSFGLLSLDSGNDINIKAKEVTLNYEGVASSPLIVSAKGNVNVADSAKIRNMGATGDLYIDATNINLAANSELRSNRGSAHIQAQKDFTSNKAGLVAAKDLTVSANNHLNLTDTKLHASTGNIQLQSSSKETALNKITVQGGSVSAAKELAIYADKDITLNNIDFIKKANSSQAQVNSINAYAGNNLSFTTANQEFPYTAGKIQLGAGNQLRLEGKDQNSKLSGGGGLKLSGKNITTKNIYMTGSGANGVDIVSNGGNILLDQGSRLWANTGDININALNGSITANSLLVSSSGKMSLIASKDINLNSIQETIDTPWADKDETKTIQTSLAVSKGITISTVEDGKISLNAGKLTASQGKIEVSSQNGISLEGNTDIYITGDTGRERNINSVLTAQEISLNNNKSDIQIKNTHLSSTLDNLTSSNKVGMTTIKDSVLTSKGNTELHAKDLLTLQGVNVTSDQHLAVSSGRTVYINAEYTPGTKWIPNKITNLTSKGVTSVTATGNQVLQNTNIIGGAVLMEAGGFILDNGGMNYKATGSDLLKNDAKLNLLNGDLSIQTGNNLTIDPSKHKLSAVGDIDLISKKGTLTLKGTGGTKGNGSEQVVKLNTDNGRITLQGTTVRLDASKLKADKDINIVATSGDVIIDALKNTYSVTGANRAQQLKLQLGNIDKSLEDLRFYIAGNALMGSATLQVIFSMRGYKQESIDEIMNILLGTASLNADREAILQEIKQAESATNKAKQFNGYEHVGSELISGFGNINITSSNGILARNADIKAFGTLSAVNLEANGVLNKTVTARESANQVAASILIDGVNDGYEIGKDTDSNYTQREYFQGSTVSGRHAVKIRSTGQTADANIEIQGADILGLMGRNNLLLESGAGINLTVGVDQGYDRSTNTTTKRSWYGKKKKITTTSVSQIAEAIPTTLIGGDIKILSKGDTKLYSTQLHAVGDINVDAKNIYLYAVDEHKKKETTKKTRSSLLGIKYNDSKSVATHEMVKQLPLKATADYINTRSEFDTLIQGSEFNYQDAHFKAGGTITLEGASTTVTKTLNKQSNSVVWQSMQDKGSITETAKLPSFNGPVAPKFEAKGGLTVQVAVVSGKDNDVRAEVLKLANQPGNAYLKDLVNRKDVNWEAVKLAQESWDYNSQGLTAAGAAILAIAIAAATGGAGVGAILSTGGTVTNAALLSLTTQASISLINNGGNLSATFKELGSKDSVKSLAITVVTAGLVEGLSTSLKIDLNGFPTAEKIANNFVQGVGSNLISSTLQGESLSDSLEKALLAGVTNALQAEMATKIGTHLDKIDPSAWEYALHKIAHAAAGCVAAAVQKECEAGAIGASVAEVVAGFFDKPSSTATQEEKDAFRKKVVGTTKLVSGVVAAYSGYDVNIAASSAENAVTNNYLTAQQVKNLRKAISDCKNNSSCLKDVDAKYFGGYDSKGTYYEVNKSIWGINDDAYAKCTTIECKITHATQRQSGLTELMNQPLGNITFTQKLTNYRGSYALDQFKYDENDQYVASASKILSFVDLNCGGSIDAACNTKWQNYQDKQLRDTVLLFGAIAAVGGGAAGGVVVRACLSNPAACNVNLRLAIDGLFAEGAIYGPGAVGITAATRNQMLKEAEDLKVLYSKTVLNQDYKPTTRYQDPRELANYLSEQQKVDIRIGKTLSGAKSPITVTAETKIGGKYMFDTNQTARPEANRIDTPTLAAGSKVNPNNPNLTMKNAHAEVALIQRAYEAGLTKGENMEILVRGKEVCSYCVEVMQPMYERSGLKQLTIYDTDRGIATTYQKVIITVNEKPIIKTKISQTPFYGR